MFVELTKTCMTHSSYVSYSIQAYMELKVIQENNILTLYIAMSKLRSMEGNTILLDQEVQVCGIYIVANPHSTLLF